MRVIGKIVRLQVQPQSLKVGVAPLRRYDPAPLCPVEALTLTQDGVQGWTEDGSPVPDVHNRTHPDSKNRGGTNGLSVCFTAHYRKMRDRFGDHLVDGIAGENILIETEEEVGADDLRNGLMIEAADGQSVHLEGVIVAAPCVEFARYALRFPDDASPDRTMTEAIQFLHGGLRGYYATYRGSTARIDRGADLGVP